MTTTPNSNGNSDGGFTAFSRTDFRTDHDVQGMTKALYEDAGMEWPDWIGNPDDDTSDQNASRLTVDKFRQIPDEGSGQQQQQEPPTPQMVQVGDRTIPADEIETVLSFQDYLKNNPEKAQQIVQVLRGEQPQQQQQQQEPPQPPPPPQPPQPPQLPEGFTADDPMHKFMLSRMNEMTETLNRMQQVSEAQQQEFYRSKAQMEMGQALDQFRAAHPELSDKDVTEARRATAELNVIGGLVQGRYANNPVEGIVRGLEVGMWSVPSIRDKFMSGTNPNQTSSSTHTTSTKTRQQKLSALSPSGSGSAPRTEARPRLDSDGDMKHAIAGALETVFGRQ